MGNAIWLFFALPKWYFSTILAPFSVGPLTGIPALGIVALAIGAVWGSIMRRRGLLIFLVLPAASQVLVIVAGFMRGQLAAEVHEPILLAFLLLQTGVAGYFVFRLSGARLPATALAIFTLSYALFSAFVATMAFNDSWL